MLVVVVLVVVVVEFGLGTAFINHEPFGFHANTCLEISLFCYQFHKAILSSYARLVSYLIHIQISKHKIIAICKVVLFNFHGIIRFML